MDNKEISRRETLSLAKFGLLLAAGLGVVEPTVAQGPAAERMLRLDFEPGSLVVKLYKYDGQTYTMFKALGLPAVQSKQLLGDSAAQFTIKFWRPAGGGKQEAQYGNLTGSLLKT